MQFALGRKSSLYSAATRGSARVVPVATRAASKRSVANPSELLAFPLIKTRSINVVGRASTTADKGAVATPTVKIDNIHDPFATLVMVDVGSTLEMFDTIQALKNLGLNIRRAKLEQTLNTFYITEGSTSEKIVKSARLEEIRMTVLNSLESKLPAESFITGDSGYATDESKSKTFRGVVQTTIEVSEASNGSCSVLKIKTADRPGLLVDIVRVLKDINLNVVSAEVDTVGAEAQDEFFITYRGEPLSSPMVTLVTNALQYYLSLAEVATQESY